MKKIISLFLVIVMVSIAGCSNIGEKGTTGTLLEIDNYFDNQTKVDENLLKELKNGHTLDNPFVVVNPYGNAPLSAIVIFSTDEKTGVKITVKGRSTEDDVKGASELTKDHIVPIYGLYVGGTTSVELTLDDGTSNTIDIVTDSIESLPETEANMMDANSYDYSNLTFASVLMSGAVYAYDSKGDIRWVYTGTSGMPLKRLENGHLMMPTSTIVEPLYYASGLVEADMMGKIYNWYLMPGGQHHDFVELDNGNLLVAGDRSDFSTVEDYIVEIDRKTGKVLYELDLKDVFDDTDGSGVERTDHDWFHNNGLVYDKETDNIILSGRHIDAVVAVNKTEKKLSWILGDPEGWTTVDKSYFFTPIGDNFEWQYLQHQVSILPNGDIMMFDNGGTRTKVTKPEEGVSGDGVYSRAVAYKIDTENMTIEQTWEYGKDRGPSWYSEWISGAVCLDEDSDNIWITAGSNLFNPDTGSYDYGPNDMFIPGMVYGTNINQVKNNELVYELKLNALTYRSIRLPMYTEASSDLNQKGKYLGTLGITKTADVTVDFTNPQASDSTWELAQTPEQLTFTGTYTMASEGDLKDSYLVLKQGDKTLAYLLKQTVDETEGQSTVTMSGWVSTGGLEKSAFDVYILKDGVTYNTGSSVKFE